MNAGLLELMKSFIEIITIYLIEMKKNQKKR